MNGGAPLPRADEVSVIIADDEPLARRRIRRLIEDEPGVHVVAETMTGAETVNAVRTLRPDLLFLDIQLPDGDGFSVMEALRDELAASASLPVVVFVTAYDQYALKAFEVHALDYVLKPFDGERLRAALARARAALDESSSARRARQLLSLLDSLRRDDVAPAAPAAPPASAPADERAAIATDRLMIKSNGSLFFIKVADIDWIEAAGNYARLHVGRETHLIRETMQALESRLDPNRFVRIHRSTIVNLDCVKEMQPWFSGEYTVLLRDGRQLKLSRWYRERLEERMGRR